MMMRAAVLFLGASLAFSLEDGVEMVQESVGKHSKEVQRAQQIKGVFDNLFPSLRRQQGKKGHMNSATVAAKFAAQLLQAGGREKITPEVRTGIEQIIATIDTDIIFHIKQDHDGTQEKIDYLVEAHTNKSLTANTRYNDAKTKDTTWYNCVAAEVGLIPTTCDNSTPVNCPPNGLYSYTVAENKRTLTCDFSGGNDCSKELNGWQPVRDDALGFKAELENWVVENLETPGVGLQLDSSNYVAAKQSCETAVDHQEGNCTEAWCNKRAECAQNMASRQVGICRFGDAYQHKCEAKAAYDALILQVNGAGTIYSESDRQNEYDVAELIKCLLQGYLDTNTLDASTMTTCQAQQNDYSTVIGTMNLRTTEYNTYLTTFSPTSTTNYFKCDETSITFYGRKYTVPTCACTWPLTCSASDYVDNPWSAPVSADPTQPAFSFCAVGETGHQCSASSFTATDCPSGTTYQSTSICQLNASIGCTSADCCA
jgi:hypothetical protein